MPDQHEIEIKFYMSEPQALRQKLIELGAESISRVFEQNLRLDDAHRSLNERKVVLRLRENRKKDQSEAVMTVKTPTEIEAAGLSVRREIEIGIAEVESMRAALSVLGFDVIWRYEKRRETFAWEEIKAEIDETPMGWFLELEGTAEGIKRLADRLGLDIQDGISESYAALFKRVKQAMALTMSDLTFAAFEEISVPGEMFDQRESGGSV